MSTSLQTRTGHYRPERACINSIQRPHRVITRLVYTSRTLPPVHSLRGSWQFATHPRPSLLITLPPGKTYTTVYVANQSQHQAWFTPKTHRSLTLSLQFSALIDRPETLHCQLPRPVVHHVHRSKAELHTLTLQVRGWGKAHYQILTQIEVPWEWDVNRPTEEYVQCLI